MKSRKHARKALWRHGRLTDRTPPAVVAPVKVRPSGRRKIEPVGHGQIALDRQGIVSAVEDLDRVEPRVDERLDERVATAVSGMGERGDAGRAMDGRDRLERRRSVVRNVGRLPLAEETLEGV